MHISSCLQPRNTAMGQTTLRWNALEAISRLRRDMEASATTSCRFRTQTNQASCPELTGVASALCHDANQLASITRVSEV